jgi:hypothetical protein
MHMIGRIGFMGLGIALVGALSGAPVFAADKPIEDLRGSQWVFFCTPC